MAQPRVKLVKFHPVHDPVGPSSICRTSCEWHSIKMEMILGSKGRPYQKRLERAHLMDAKRAQFRFVGPFHAWELIPGLSHTWEGPSQAWEDPSQAREGQSQTSGSILGLEGPTPGLRGPIPGLRGPIPGLRGPIAGLRRPILGLRGPMHGPLHA